MQRFTHEKVINLSKVLNTAPQHREHPDMDHKKINREAVQAFK